MLTVIPIYNIEGEVVNEIEIQDKLTFLAGRVCKGEEFFYKGVGVPYTCHFLFEKDHKNSEEFDVLDKSKVFYLGDKIIRKKWKDKFGIFQEKYLPFFPDFIGGCSTKEGLIVLNSEIFKKSSVEIIDAFDYDKENEQIYFKMIYKCERKKYIIDNGNPQKLKELLEYMVDNNWNFLWDKRAIMDISPDGLVSDVADIFMSEDLGHKLGTVYSLFYSLESYDRQKYIDFLNVLNYSHTDQTSFIFNSVKFLQERNVNVAPFFTENDPLKNYKNIVLNYLVQGKNCAYCACDLYKDQGNQVRDYFIKQVSEQMKHM